MGRSVSTHRHAVATVYLNPEFEDDGGDGSEWRSFIEDLKENVLKPKYRAAQDCDRWIDREDHVILESRTYEVSVSEYCGLVAICLAPRHEDSAMGVAATKRMAASFEKHIQTMFKNCALVSLGRFSNGEQVFNRI